MDCPCLIILIFKPLICIFNITWFCSKIIPMKFGYTYRGFLPYATFGTAGKSRISQILILSAAPNKIWFEVHDGFIGQKILKLWRQKSWPFGPGWAANIPRMLKLCQKLNINFIWLSNFVFSQLRLCLKNKLSSKNK